MTTNELEKLRDEYLDEIDLIEDELNSRDPLADE